MPRIPKSLKEGLREGRVIPFVGAGVSMAVERVGGGRLFPSWRELLLRGAERAEAEGKKGAIVRGLVEDDEPDYLQAAEKLRKKLGSFWASFLSDAIDVSRAEVANESLALAQAVWRLGSRLVLTTNYDRVLEWACPDELRDDLKTWEIENPAQQAGYLRQGTTKTATVWHLHGHIDKPTELILTPDGYRRLYPSAGEIEPHHRAALQTLRSLMAMRSLLFVGFSLDDEHFGIELQGVQDVFEGSTGPHYVLVRERDVERFRYLETPVEPLVFEGFGEPLLELVEELGGATAPSSRVAADEPEPVDVYLAAVADSLQDLQKRVHDDLIREGTSVVWKIPPPFEEESHRIEAERAMRRARLSVHLLDGYTGMEIPGAEGKTYSQEQVRLGIAHARSQIVWVPRSLEVVQSHQQAFLHDLQASARGSSRYDFQRGSPTHLVQDILDRLKRESRPQPGRAPPPAVLIDTHEKDQGLATAIIADLAAHGIVPFTNPVGDDPRQRLDHLKGWLGRVAALVIFHGSVDGDWVCSRLEVAAKTLITELGDLDKLLCVYLAPPEEKRLDRYERYHMLNLRMLDNRRGFKPATLGPIYEHLGTGP